MQIREARRKPDVGSISCKLIVGDCIDVIPKLCKFDLIFADPPFNINENYPWYHDSRKDYRDFTLRWIAECWKSCHGVLALHGPDDLMESYLSAARFLEMNRIGWVNWHYRFGQCRRTNWIDTRCHCLFFSKEKEYTWNPEKVLVESDRVKYKDKRINDTERGGKRLPGTVWGVSGDGPYWGRVTGNSKERSSIHPNQLPIRYLQRIVLAYTNPGDWVLDPFIGSGTTGLVCNREQRNFIGIDVSEEAILSSKQRIEKGFYREHEKVDADS